jgi:predicted acyltransferase
MQTANRLLSLDVMRGLTIAGMILVNNPGDWGNLYAPLEHAEWHGCTPTDWVFPFFLFMVGVAIPLALGKRKERGDDQGQISRKIVSRSLIIIGLGLFLAAHPMFYFRDKTSPWFVVHLVIMAIAMLTVFTREVLNQSQFQTVVWQQRRKWVSYLAWAMIAGMVVLGFFYYDFSHMRFPGVLQRIGLVYLACGFLFLKTTPKVQLLTGIGLLLLYWALMTLVPVPDGYAPNLDMETNLAAWFDRTILTTNHLWAAAKTWDPEGLLSTLPAIATGIAGMLTGEWLRSNRTDYEKVSGILAVGALLFALGLIWNEVFPLNKKIWTSSYVVYMAGISLLFLGTIYWLVDIKGWKGWIAPFQVYGVNALFAFLLSGIVGRLLGVIKVAVPEGEPIGIGSWMYQHSFAGILSPINASLAWAICMVVFIWSACWILYRNRIYIKV